MIFPLLALAAAVVLLSRDTPEQTSVRQEERPLPPASQNTFSGDHYRREIPSSSHNLIGTSRQELHISIFGQYHPDSINPSQDSQDPYLALAASFIVQDLFRGAYLTCSSDQLREDIFVEGRVSDLLPEDIANINDRSRPTHLFPNLNNGLANASVSFFESNSNRISWLAEYGPASLYSIWGNTQGNRRIYLHASDDIRHAQSFQRLFVNAANHPGDAGISQQLIQEIAQRQVRLGEQIARFLCAHPEQKNIRVIYGVFDFQMHLVHNMILGMNQYWTRYPTRACSISSLPSQAIIHSVCWAMPEGNPNSEPYEGLCNPPTH